MEDEANRKDGKTKEPDESDNRHRPTPAVGCHYCNTPFTMEHIWMTRDGENTYECCKPCYILWAREQVWTCPGCGGVYNGLDQYWPATVGAPPIIVCFCSVCAQNHGIALAGAAPAP